MGHCRQWISRATDRPKLPVIVVDLGGTYYNTKPQVEALETLLRKLPNPTTPAPPPVNRPKPRRARQLDADQIQKLIQGYTAGATTYELGDRFGIRPTNGQQHPPPTRRGHAPTWPLPRPSRRRDLPLQRWLVTSTHRGTSERRPDHRAEPIAEGRRPHPRHPQTTPTLNRPVADVTPELLPIGPSHTPAITFTYR
jgi:hypothetical protein